jgi:hypothetical protein
MTEAVGFDDLVPFGKIAIEGVRTVTESDEPTRHASDSMTRKQQQRCR